MPINTTIKTALRYHILVKFHNYFFLMFLDITIPYDRKKSRLYN